MSYQFYITLKVIKNQIYYYKSKKLSIDSFINYKGLQFTISKVYSILISGDIMKDRIVKGEIKEKRYIINIKNRDKAKELLMDKYNYYINSLKVNSNRILFLTLNRSQSQNYKDNLKFDKISSIRIGSYFSFIQNELKKFWPLVLDSCDFIENKRLRPIFMTFEASQNLMIKLVEYLRNKGQLNDLVMEEEEIAQKMLSNLGTIAFSNNNYKSYKKLMMTNSFEGDMYSEEVYEALGKLLDLYVERVLNNGALDYALAVYMYNNYLLKDKRYLKHLREEIDYILVDGGELISPSQINLIKKLEKSVEELCIVYNPLGPYGIYMQNEEYLLKTIYNDYFLIDYDNEENSFYSEIEKNIFDIRDEIIERDYIHKKFDFISKSHLHKELIKDLYKLLKEKGNLDNVSIISPVRDISLDYMLEVFSKKHKINYLNLNKQERIIDNIEINALLTFTTLYYNYKDIIINEDELKNMFVVLLDTNLIKASLISKVNSVNNYLLKEIEDEGLASRLGKELVKKYKDLIDFFKELKDNKLDIDQVLKMIFIRYYLKKEDKKSIKDIKALIDSASNFLEIMKLFESIKDINFEFLKFIREGAKESENIYDIQEKNKFVGLIYSSPTSYLNFDKNSEELFIIDLSNTLWALNNTNKLQNPYILSKGWEGKGRYNFEYEVENKKKMVLNIFSRILESQNGNIYLYNLGNKGEVEGINLLSIFYK